MYLHEILLNEYESREPSRGRNLWGGASPEMVLHRRCRNISKVHGHSPTGALLYMTKIKRLYVAFTSRTKIFENMESLYYNVGAFIQEILFHSLNGAL